MVQNDACWLTFTTSTACFDQWAECCSFLCTPNKVSGFVARMGGCTSLFPEVGYVLRLHRAKDIGNKLGGWRREAMKWGKQNALDFTWNRSGLVVFFNPMHQNSIFWSQLSLTKKKKTVSQMQDEHKSFVILFQKCLLKNITYIFCKHLIYLNVWPSVIIHSFHSYYLGIINLNDFKRLKMWHFRLLLLFIYM